MIKATIITGRRGSGKTTLARKMAQFYNCVVTIRPDDDLLELDLPVETDFVVVDEVPEGFDYFKYYSAIRYRFYNSFRQEDRMIIEPKFVFITQEKNLDRIPNSLFEIHSLSS